MTAKTEREKQNRKILFKDERLNDAEEWRDIPDFPGYQVTEGGRVRKIYLVVQEISYANKPYQGVKIVRGDGQRKHQMVHRLVATAFHGPAPSAKHVVAHNDGNPFNRHSSQSENHMDKHTHGTMPDQRGERHGASKLTADDIRAIRHEYTQGKSQEAIAKKYGVWQPHIGRIVRRERWGHIP